MTDPASDTENRTDYWKNRSAGWTEAATAAKPNDDTFNLRLIEEVGITPNMDVLDVASGTGDPAITIAGALEIGSVTACDMTSEMLAVAAARAAKLSIINLRIAAGNMNALPFSNSTFDAITSRNGLMFPDDKVGCAREVLRVLKPEGTAGWMVWGPIEANPTFLAVNAGLEKFFSEKFPPRMIRHNLGAPGLLTDVIKEAGFTSAKEIELKQERLINVGDNYFRRAVARTAPHRIGNLTERDWMVLLENVQNACANYLDGDIYRIPVVARLGIGTAGS
ncbi:MAG: methyltransferase domain-containing protein [Alphaproteobacteria bacterium]|nr:methyltransferase domain-containing protein [Alphaproteobacteria bacterium]